jgi:alpha-glucosidase
MAFSTQLPDWLAAVHHDGSEKYVSEPYPRLNESVHLRLRVGREAPVRRVLLRTFPDGEQALALMERGEEDGAAVWWQAELPIRQPGVHYRFLLEAEDGVWWYGANGASAETPLDGFDFQILADYHAPAWLGDAVFYQIFPDRFADGDPGNNPRPEEYEVMGMRPHTSPWGAPAPEGQHGGFIFYGGDLQGIAQHLDYLQSLGVNALYFTPIFTAHSNHKYDVADYEHVDPHFGGDEALVRLRAELDRRGMHYILDIVPNHCGLRHPWFLQAQQDAASPEAEFFTFTSHPYEYASWMGFRSLPKLNYASLELRRRMYAGPDAVFRRWLRPPYRADGWRVDVANMLGRQGPTQIGDEIARGIRQAVKESAPDSYLFGENFYDATRQLQGDQWDGVMNYMGFGSSLLHWLCGLRIGAFGLREQVSSPVPFATSALEATWRARRAAIPWAVLLQQYNLLDSHDTSRLLTQLNGNIQLHKLAATLLLTFPGVPGLYYGDEIGLTDVPGLRSRGCMPWDEQDWDQELLAFYRALIALRRGSPILKRGGFQVIACEQDTLAYQREGLEGRIVVAAQRSAAPRPAGPMDIRPAGIADGTRLVEFFSGRSAVVVEGRLELPELEQGATVWIERQV